MRTIFDIVGHTGETRSSNQYGQPRSPYSFRQMERAFPFLAWNLCGKELSAACPEWAKARTDFANRLNT